MANCLITGTNRGLGLAFTKWAADQGHNIYASSRNPMPELSQDRSKHISHIQADYTDAEKSVQDITDKIGDIPLDFIIHNAGLVEASYEELDVQQAQDLLSVNLTVSLMLTQNLIPNMRAGNNKKVIFIGSVSGQNNSHCPAIFYAASRMGIVGAAQNLRQNYKSDGISFPVIEPGRMATDMDYDDGQDAAITEHNGKRMPVHDVIRIVECILSLSPVACPTQFTVPDQKFGPV